MAYRRLVVLATVLLACGIDEAGLMPGDASVGDASIDVVTPPDAASDVVNDVPMSCMTLDVSACVDSGIPDGWAAIVTTTTVGSCPTTADYAQTNYVDTLAASGPCTCGCTPTGSLTCTGTVEWVSNNNCNFPTSTPNAIDGGGPGCYSVSNQQDFSFGPLTYSAKAVSPPGCDAGATSAPSVTSNGVTVCAAQCTADYCHVTGQFNRCIWSASATSCPAPFVTEDIIGKDADTTVACGCGCNPRKMGNCTASVSLYSMGGCSGTPSLDASDVDGGPSCNDTAGTHINSFAYQPGPPPTVVCDPNGGTTPTVAFGTTQMTVCCLP